MRRTHAVAVGLVAAGILAVACVAPGASGGPTTPEQAARLALAQEPRFAGIALRDDQLIGQAAWYQVQTSADGWQVTIRIGWGDCPSGCINEHRWIYDVGRDGRVGLTSEHGSALPDHTGISGMATAGPTCPVVTEPPDPACADRPVAGATLVVTDLAGSEIARTVTDADGRFTIELAPGTYRLVPQPVEGLMGTAAVVNVTVEAQGLLTGLLVGYDTGIR